MKKIIWLFIILLLFPIQTSLGEDALGKSAEEVFFKANQAYKSGRFQDAAGGYLWLIENGIDNGHIYYNLGNSYFKLGNIGRAILYYERSRLLIPRDADLKFNLSLAHDRTLDDITESKSFIVQSFFWLNALNIDEIFLGFTVLNILFFGILSIRRFHKAEWTYYAFIFLLVLWGIGLSSFFLKWHQLGTDDRAVVLAEETDVLAGPNPQDTLLFKLHEGAIVHYERAEDGWSLIHLSDTKRGWIKNSFLEKICKRRMDAAMADGAENISSNFS